jgi:hypothetical protein
MLATRAVTAGALKDAHIKNPMSIFEILLEFHID